MLVYRIIFLAVVVFVFVMFLNLLLNPFPDLNKAKTEITFSRLLYSKAIHYNNPLDERVHNNILDIDKLVKFQQEDKLELFLREEFYHPSRSDLIVFKLDLDYDEKILISNNDYYGPFFSNETAYKLLYPKSGFDGSGAVTSALRIYPTSCLVNSNIVPCTATLSLLVPNS